MKKTTIRSWRQLFTYPASDALKPSKGKKLKPQFLPPVNSHVTQLQMKLKEKNLPNVVTCFLQFNLYRNNENPFMHKIYYLRVLEREREQYLANLVLRGAWMLLIR